MSTNNQPDVRDDPHEAHEFDVQQIHAPVYREHDEPHDGLEPIPVWMAVVFGGLLFWGGMYLTANSGDFSGDVYDRHVPKAPTFKPDVIPTDKPGLIKLGEKIYSNCLACHQPSGEGQAKQFPPLNKSEWVVGEKASKSRLTAILVYGLSGEISVRGQPYNGAMPAWGGQLKDHQIAAVLTYIRNTWDNKADPILPADVAAIRKTIGARTSALTVADIEKIPLDPPPEKN